MLFFVGVSIFDVMCVLTFWAPIGMCLFLLSIQVLDGGVNKKVPFFIDDFSSYLLSLLQLRNDVAGFRGYLANSIIIIGFTPSFF